jgi:toxin YoeB
VIVRFVPNGWNDYVYWQNSDRAMVKRINRLIDDIGNGDPFQGIGKPEPVRHQPPGAWSRRIDDRHRLVYVVTQGKDRETEVTVLTCRYHYDR